MSAQYSGYGYNFFTAGVYSLKSGAGFFTSGLTFANAELGASFAQYSSYAYAERMFLEWGGGQQLNNANLGQPGEWESIIPIWGPGRAAIDHFQNGNYWRGVGYTALAISDAFLVKSLATGVGKGAWKLGSHTWNATRKWMVKNGYADAGEPLHHWAITQAVAKKYGVEAIANQPWNLTRFGSQASHMRWAHGQMYQGIQYPFANLLYPITSTPTWFKATVVSGGGRIIN